MGDTIAFPHKRRSHSVVETKIVDGVPIRVVCVDDLSPADFADWFAPSKQEASSKGATREGSASSGRSPRPSRRRKMSEKLTEWEIQILREVAGEIPASSWGAAISAALERLAESGYLTDTFGRLTDKGRRYLNEFEGRLPIDKPPAEG